MRYNYDKQHESRLPAAGSKYFDAIILTKFRTFR